MNRTFTFPVILFLLSARQMAAQNCLPIGCNNMIVNISPWNFVSCPGSPVQLTTAYSGVPPIVVTAVSSTTPSQEANPGQSCNPDPSSSSGCPSSAYVTATLASPSGMRNPMDAVSIQSIYFKLDND